MKILVSHPNIIDAVKELDYWINDKNTPMPNRIARIHKQHLGLFFDKYEDDGEFINQWVRLGTRQELQQVGSIGDHIVTCLNNFISR